MIYASISELASAIPQNGKLLGLDLGSKRIGLAISDKRLMIATPVNTLKRTRLTKDLEAIMQVYVERGVEGLVIGLPLNMDGREGPACQSARQFAANLENVFSTRITFWDERLSTSAVERILIDEADLTRKRRSEIIDKVAAAYILQGALDFLNSENDNK